MRNLRFETDYGVDAGLLLDLAMASVAIEQVDIGHIQHDSQTLETLGDMARQVVRVILDRASQYGRLELQQIREVAEIERQSQAELSVHLQANGPPARLALFDMDGTLLQGRFVVNLAQRTNKTADLGELLDRHDIAADERTRRIAALFEGIPKEIFEEVARCIPLTPGAAEVVVGLRKNGYRVGLVSDSFFVATEIVRRRVFADFSVAHVMKFRRGVASGDVTLCPAMYHSDGCKKHHLCKKNILLHLCEQSGIRAEQVLAAGDGEPDACMLATAGISVAFEPKTDAVRASAQHVLSGSLLEILPLLS